RSISPERGNLAEAKARIAQVGCEAEGNR
ncbi:MAG: hypothetical protein JWO28_2109, partial [Hyphomicrobiales bacterium]|nr:hypothetical protein [Hyphomicrobiales bacterium]